MCNLKPQSSIKSLTCTFLLYPVLTIWCSCASSVCGVSIRLDFSLDEKGSDFFGAGNPAGLEAGANARHTLGIAAGLLAGLVEDELAAISDQPDLRGESGGTLDFSWSFEFLNPDTGHPVDPIQDKTKDKEIAADTIVIYVGARENIIGDDGQAKLAVAQPARYVDRSTISGTPSNDLMLQQFAFEKRNMERQHEGFSPAVGMISFDSLSPFHYFDQHGISLPPPNQYSFFTVALHEIMHVLGVGSSTQWNNLAVDNYLRGRNSVAVQGGNIPLNSHADHVEQSVASDLPPDGLLLGLPSPQSPILTPNIAIGKLHIPTQLDLAMLVDIGWSIPSSLPMASLGVDINLDGIVDAADLAFFIENYGTQGEGLGIAGDVNGDFGVSGQDFLILQRAFGTLGASMNVPEPQTNLLVIATYLLWKANARLRLGRRSGPIRRVSAGSVARGGGHC